MSDDVRAAAALVLFSGGQDSATCLAWALERFSRVETVGFDYGQRHRVELDQRGIFMQAMCAAHPAWAARLGEDVVLDLGVIASLGESALTSERAITLAANGLPNTFVPGRNLLFLTFAAALAYRRDISVLIGGMCETDYSGYPDCRDATMRSQQRTLTLGLAYDIAIETPLMWLDKAATWQLAEQIGGHALVDLVVEHTHSCYLGDRTRRHDWGFGCGHCPACELRRIGWERYKSR